MLRLKGAAIDGFRLAALLLVVAVHTSPLASFSETADFIFTRALARVAVPFFFMVTGYFVLGARVKKRPEKIKRFMLRTAACYAAAILLYLPLNWYIASRVPRFEPASFLQDLLFNGTAYHLWYLPAVLLGLPLAALLIQKLKMPAAVALAGLLYAVALGGDSYYGLAARLPLLNSVYDGLFRVFAFTRNGLLMAPLFLVLGAAMAKARRIRLKHAVIGLGVSLPLMVSEALALRHYALQRHDSMYVLLPVVMVFLFGALLAANKSEAPALRGVSTLGYILHLWVILGVRRIAGALGLRDILLGQSLIHYVVVAAITLAVSFMGVWAAGRLKRRAAKADPRARAWVEVDLDAIAGNVETIRKTLPPQNKIMAVVKANAYGHGDIAVARYLGRRGVGAFAVATLQEGIGLRKARVRGEILILGYTDAALANTIARFDLIQTVCGADHARALNAHAARPVRVHIKIDTGMHRLGQSWAEPEAVAPIFRLPNIRVEGMFSHLSASDSRILADVEFTERQIERFFSMAAELKKQNCETGKLHIQGSYGALNYPNVNCDYARIGILMYGAASSPQNTPRIRAMGLKPALALKARVAALRRVSPGETVGYGRDCRAAREAAVATVSIGYADGVPRSYGEAGAYVLIGGEPAPVIGRICMDQMMVDVSGILGVAVGDVVTLIGADGAREIGCEQFAQACGTITNEILSRLGARLAQQHKTEDSLRNGQSAAFEYNKTARAAFKRPAAGIAASQSAKGQYGI